MYVNQDKPFNNSPTECQELRKGPAAPESWVPSARGLNKSANLTMLMVEHPAQVKSTLSSGGYLGFELRCYELVPNSGFFLY